jgi:DNA-binding PadR family transcriptional regulator
VSTDNPPAGETTGEASTGRGRRPSRAGRGGSQLELALLGILGDGEMHGYELKKQLDAVLLPWTSVSFGSLYPALNRLERAGDVRTVADDDPDDTPDPSTPSTGTLSGELATFRSKLMDRSTRPVRARRGRKVYTITADGRARLVDLLTDLDPGDDRTFVLQVAFSRHLGSSQRLAVFARRRAELARRLQQASTTSGIDRWQELLRKRSVATISDEITWIDSLMSSEQQVQSPSQSPDIDPPNVPSRAHVPATTGGNP